MSDRLAMSAYAHISKGDTLPKIMWMVTLSLLPAGLVGIWIFGFGALRVILLGILGALVTEAAIQKYTKRKVTIPDGSAFLTGLLLAYNLPPGVPFWMPLAGSFFSIAIGKQIFGGLGKNILNPALLGRAFLVGSWPQYMTKFTAPFSYSYDSVASATPLTLLKEGKSVGHISYADLFFGVRAGCIGEVCIVALLLGALFLLWKRYISWHIPVVYIATTGVFIYVFGGKFLFSGDWLFHILSGGLILGAFFMATDYVTSPLTRKGQVIFAVGCGLLTAGIRLWSRYPEGVCYSILVMNIATPFIDRYTKR